MEIINLGIEDLIPYARNSRTHSDSQVAQIAASIREFGFTNPVLIDDKDGIIAGHGRVLAARKLKLDEVPCIRLSHLTDAQKKAYVIADNKLALNSGWDEELLKLELQELKELNYDIDVIGFDEEELKTIFSDLQIEDDSENPYSLKIDTPTYEPTGEKPLLEELYDDEKAMDLIVSIQESKLPEKEKKFLMAAASRHIVFDYGKIANYYSHSSKEVQELMENNALVIIDFNKAIENGLVRVTEEINNMIELDYDE